MGDEENDKLLLHYAALKPSSSYVTEFGKIVR